MDRAHVVELVGRLAAVDASWADRERLAAAAADVARLRAWVDEREATVAGLLARVSSFPEKTLAEAMRSSFRDGERAVERSGVLGALPGFRDALAAGEIGGGHVDALGRSLRSLEPAQRERLLDEGERLERLARTSTPEAFASELRRTVARMRADDGMERLAQQRRETRLRTWVDTASGMWCLAGQFDPLTGVRLANRLNAIVESLFREQTPTSAPSDPRARQDHLRALALASLIEGTVAAAAAGRPEFVAVIDADAPAEAGGPTVDWGLPIEIPARVLAALAGTADVHAVVVRNGVVLHAPGQLRLGRTTRVANRAQRRALRGLYATCAVPGCQVHYDRCKLHHAIWWRHGGLTDIENLLPLCERHHHHVHDDGWGLQLAVDRTLRIRMPDGQELATGPPRRRAA